MNLKGKDKTVRNSDTSEAAEAVKRNGKIRIDTFI